eukprot:Colp12_sorted_trinity150504_noHs@26931
MGAHMARNLLKAKHDLVVFDINKDAMKNLESHGAKTALNPKELASVADCVITMLPSNPHVKEAYGGKDGVLQSISEGALLIDASTIDPAVAREVAAMAAEKKADFLDAPVSGG